MKKRDRDLRRLIADVISEFPGAALLGFGKHKGHYVIELQTPAGSSVKLTASGSPSDGKFAEKNFLGDLRRAFRGRLSPQPNPA